MKLPFNKKYLPFIVIPILAGVYYYLTTYRYIESTNDAYVKTDITWVSPRVSGEVIALSVKNNDEVEKGQLLLKIDDREAIYKRKIFEANLESIILSKSLQEQEIKEIESDIASSQAQVVGAKAEVERTELEYNRFKDLVSQGITSRQNFESKQSDYKIAKSQLKKVEQEFVANKIKAEKARVTKSKIEADILAAKINLDLLILDEESTSIKSPISGTVGDFNIKKGTKVFSQTRLLAIVDLKSSYIEANFKETKTANMRVGQKVSIEIDAYSGRTFDGHIVSLSPAAGIEFSVLPIDNSSGNFNKIVQRIPVVISLDNHYEGSPLRAGLSAIVSVDTRL